MLGAIEGQGEFAFDNKEYAFSLRVQFGLIAAAIGANLNDVLREGFSEPRQRAGDDPHAHVVPKRQVAGDDVTHHAFGDNGIGFGEHRTISQKLVLIRMATVWGVVSCLAHREGPL